jgi:predicted CoA-binding protein
VVSDRPHDVNDQSIFPPNTEGETGYLVFRKLVGQPDSVDIVNVYRPAEEHAGIVASIVVPLGAKVLWLQPPVTSAEAPDLAKAHGLAFVEGTDIAELARSLKGGK